MKTVVGVSLLGLLCAGGGSAFAVDNANINARGPAPFTAWDTDGSGGVDKAEFEAMREQRQAAVKAAGRQGRNMDASSPFARIDSNGDGIISQEELAIVQAVRSQSRVAANRGGSRMSKRGGMGNLHHMDAETRQKYDEFLVSTLKLRQDIAAKRVEKGTVMRLAEPDADRAAQLSRELIELRTQLMKQANEAGVPFGDGMRHRGHGGGSKGAGKGHNQR